MSFESGRSADLATNPTSTSPAPEATVDGTREKLTERDEPTADPGAENERLREPLSVIKKRLGRGDDTGAGGAVADD